MSWSFEIVGGDLSPVSDKTGLGVVTGKKKTLQDLRHALTEAMGTDPMHPEYGSLIDGGRLPDGTVVESLVGSSQSSVFRIEEEVSRVIQDFVSKQNMRIKSDIAGFGKTTVSDSEIIDRVDSIQTRFFDTKLVLQVNLITRNSNGVTITQPLG